jgi:hypothetical protein
MATGATGASSFFQRGECFFVMKERERESKVSANCAPASNLCASCRQGLWPRRRRVFFFVCSRHTLHWFYPNWFWSSSFSCVCVRGHATPTPHCRCYEVWMGGWGGGERKERAVQNGSRRCWLGENPQNQR